MTCMPFFPLCFRPCPLEDTEGRCYVDVEGSCHKTASPLVPSIRLSRSQSCEGQNVYYLKNKRRKKERSFAFSLLYVPRLGNQKKMYFEATESSVFISDVMLTLCQQVEA